jgi:hypothetical protein
MLLLPSGNIERTLLDKERQGKVIRSQVSSADGGGIFLWKALHNCCVLLFLVSSLVSKYFYYGAYFNRFDKLPGIFFSLFLRFLGKKSRFALLIFLVTS